MEAINPEQIEDAIQRVMDTHHLDADSLAELNAIKTAVGKLRAQLEEARELFEITTGGIVLRLSGESE